MWAFHGANDQVVPVWSSDQSVAALRSFRGEAGNSTVKYGRFAHAPAPVGWPDYHGHASWIPAYRTRGLFPWLLEQRRVK